MEVSDVTSLPVWAYVLIGIGGVLLIIAIISILRCFCFSRFSCYCCGGSSKKKAARQNSKDLDRKVSPVLPSSIPRDTKSPYTYNSTPYSGTSQEARQQRRLSDEFNYSAPENPYKVVTETTTLDVDHEPAIAVGSPYASQTAPVTSGYAVQQHPVTSPYQSHSVPLASPYKPLPTPVVPTPVASPYPAQPHPVTYNGHYVSYS